LFFKSRIKRGWCLFISIDPGAVFLQFLKGCNSFRLKQSLVSKFLHFLNVHRAPDALWLARSETDGIAFFINGSPDAIDPSETQCFINRLRPGHAWFSAVHLIKANKKFLFFQMVFLQPFSEAGLLRKKFRFHTAEYTK
jgi:hypothetical protein